jgi:hypothetical protein
MTKQAKTSPMICKTFEEFCGKYNLRVVDLSKDVLKIYEDGSKDPYYIPTGLTLKQFELIRTEYLGRYSKGLSEGRQSIQRGIRDLLDVDYLVQQHVDDCHPTYHPL